MKWIIDLLINKWRKAEKQEEFEPMPMYIEPDQAIEWEKEEEKEEKSVIVIDL
jgi:hypothetical protein